MWFYLTSINPLHQTRKFSFYINLLEQGFDILNRLVARGEKLTSVQLMDEKSIIDLPVESFDGGSALERIEDLEKVWKAILDQPSFPTTTFRIAILDLINRQLEVYDKQIDRIEPLLSRAEAVLLRSKELTPSHHNQILEKAYQRTVSFYRNQLERAYANSQRLQKVVYSFHSPR